MDAPAPVPRPTSPTAPAPPSAREPARPPSFDVLGVPVSIVTLDSAVATILDWCEDDVGRFVCVRDVHGVMRALEDEALMRIHAEADMVTPDGRPLALIGRRRGHPVSQTCGYDLLERIVADGVGRGVRHYFYGGDEGVADALAGVLERRFPGVRVVGTECPPFRPLDEAEDAAVVERIRASGADVVWVGLSTPKQERWMHAHRGRLPAVLMGVGAAFDFHTGRVSRAPRWMQALTLEWLHRLASDPRRLWRRYVVLAPRFLWRLARAR